MLTSTDVKEHLVVAKYLPVLALKNEEKVAQFAELKGVEPLLKLMRSRRTLALAAGIKIRRDTKDDRAPVFWLYYFGRTSHSRQPLSIQLCSTRYLCMNE